MECIGTQSYRLELPSHWRIHPVFHVSLIKPWKEGMYMQVPNSDDEITLEETNDQPIYEVETILRWRKRKKGNKLIREFLVVWTGYPLEEATWEPETNFPDKTALQEDIESGRIPEVK